MSILSIDPIPGAESGLEPVEGTPIKLAELPYGIRLRSVDAAPVGVVYMGAGDTSPFLRVQVVDSSGNPVDLTGCICELLVRQRRSDVLVFQKPGVIPAPVAGYLEYHWDANDTALGAYQARFILTDADGEQMTLPSGNPIYLEVQ